MNQAKTLRMNPQSGFTLIELMVSMLIGLLIMAGVLNVFQGNIINSRYQDNMAILQENGRFAMDMMARQLQMAGYTGCMTANITPRNTLQAGYDVDFHPERGVEGWEYNNTYYSAPAVAGEYPFVNTSTTTVLSSNGKWSNRDGALAVPTSTVEGLSINVMPGSDIMRVWGGAGSSASITGITPGANTVVTLDSVSGISQDAILVLNDCSVANIVQACNINSSTNKITLSAGCSPGNDVSLRLNISVGGGVYVMQGDVFYIGKRAVGAPPSLYRAPLNTNTTVGTGVELVEGIENMQIMYGVDTDGDKQANVYVTAKQMSTTAGDWSKVVSVRLMLLAQSVDDNVLPAPQSVVFNGATLTPTDNRVRQVFTRTVGLRNRIL